MTCHVIINTPNVSVIACTDIEESWHMLLAIECEMAAAERDYEQDLADDEHLQHEEVEFCRQRVDTDPHYEETWFEEAEHDPALVYA